MRVCTSVWGCPPLGDLGVPVSAHKLPGIVVSLPGGSLVRKFGEKRVAVVGLLLMAVGGAS